MKHNVNYLKPYRKALRNKGTPAEAFLWNYLKKSQLRNRKFRRQHSIGNYIVDFYCPEEKLAIELDGEIHKYQIEKDGLRDKTLQDEGIKVLRFENKYVFTSVIDALEEIASHFKERRE